MKVVSGLLFQFFIIDVIIVFAFAIAIFFLFIIMGVVDGGFVFTLFEFEFVLKPRIDDVTNNGPK